MPSNPYKEERRARVTINNSIQQIKGLTSNSGVNYKIFVRNVLLDCAVSENWVHKFINKYYVETKDIQIIEETIYGVKG